MTLIKKLPEDLIRQICAGEIVVRPVSIVKELIENALDANATHIKISVMNGGKSLIIIEDNGSGMSLDDLKLCLDQHATSKLKSLWSIQTLGFRGEALHAISSVSDVVIDTSQNDIGSRLVSQNGVRHFSEIKPRVGTKIEIKNIFHNMPVRLKFLRSDYIEWNLILDYMQKISLAYPHVSWEISNGKQLSNKYLATDHKNRFQDISKITDDLFEIKYNYDNYAIKGFLSKNHYSGNNLSIFVNDRYIKDKGILGCIRSILSDYIPDKRYPAGVIYLSVPANEIDVNIHPTKEEIRFMKWHQVNKTIGAALYKAINIDRAMANHHGMINNAHGVDHQNAHVSESCVSNGANNTNIVSHDINYNHIHNKTDENIVTNNHFNATKIIPNVAKKILDNKETNNINNDKTLHDHHDIASNNQKTTLYKQSYSLVCNDKKANYKILGQFQDSYIIVECEDGILLIDQHAVHERYTYEKMKSEVLSSSKGVKLLLPLELNLNNDQKSLLSHFQADLANWGLEINNNTLVAVPSFWDMKKLNYIINIFLHDLSEFRDSSSTRALWGKFLADVACKNSIKAGQQLNIRQLEEIVDFALNSSGVCNHGRKSTYLLNKREIEKMFDR